MLTPQSQLPQRVTLAYWAKVRQLLLTRHGLSRAGAKRAIQAYQSMLDRVGVRDEIYHAPVAETAEGIAHGGYATDHALETVPSSAADER